MPTRDLMTGGDITTHGAQKKRNRPRLLCALQALQYCLRLRPYLQAWAWSMHRNPRCGSNATTSSRQTSPALHMLRLMRVAAAAATQLGLWQHRHRLGGRDSSALTARLASRPPGEIQSLKDASLVFHICNSSVLGTLEADRVSTKPVTGYG